MLARPMLAVLLTCAACGGRTDEPRPSPGSESGSGSAAAAAAPAPGDAAATPAPPPQPPQPALPPPRELFGAIPADTPFVFATADPVGAAVWKRFAVELDGPALRAWADARMAIALDPSARFVAAAWAEIAAALSSGAPARALGITAAPRFALYGAGFIPVVRLELADPAATLRVLQRIAAASGATPSPRAPQTWIADGGGGALLAAVAAGQLVLARGPRAAIHAQAERLIGAAAAPLDEAALRKFAKDRGWSTQGAGWIDLAQVAAAARTPGAIPELDKLSPRCRKETLDVLGILPRIALGWTEISAARLAWAIGFELDPRTAAAIAKASRTAPSLPPKLAGDPILAVSLLAHEAQAPDDAWITRADRLATACAAEAGADDASPAVTSLPAPWDTIEAFALVLYGGAWKSFLPSDLDGFAGVLAPRPGPILAALGRWAPSLVRTPPRDGGGFVPMQIAKLAELVPDLALARKGNVLIAAGGRNGKARAGDFAAREGAPLARVFVNIATIRARLEKASAVPAKVDDDDFFTADGGPDPLPGDLIDAVDLLGDLQGNSLRLRIVVDLAPPRPKPRAAPRDPRSAIRDRCRAILRKSFTATATALAKLGVTTEVDDIAETYTTSLQADDAVRSCAKLPEAARACLLGAADPIAAAPGCAPDKDGFRPSALVLPPLFSTFGPRPLEERFHPRIDGRAVRASLVGTWVRKSSFATETWKIDAAGNVSVTRERQGKPAENERYRLEIKAAGKIELHEDDGGIDHHSLFMPGPDRFHDGDATSIADEDRFVAPLGDGFLIREPGGCSVVTREGALVAARCEVKTDAGARTLRVEHTPPCATRDPGACRREETLRFFPGWIVPRRTIEREPFMRR